MFVFVIGIIISVFLHETGHYVTARMTGMKATQFFLGFGPRLWSFRRGETEYGVRALPLGAYVRIIGMNNLDEVPAERRGPDLPPADVPAPPARHLGRLDHAHDPRRRPAVHRLRGARRARRAAGAEVTALSTGGPAAGAGLAEGDIVLRINGVDVQGADQLGRAVRSHEPGDVVVGRDRARRRHPDVDVTLGANTDSEDPNFGNALLGVGSIGVDSWEERSLGAAASTASPTSSRWRGRAPRASSRSSTR